MSKDELLTAPKEPYRFCDPENPRLLHLADPQQVEGWAKCKMFLRTKTHPEPVLVVMYYCEKYGSYHILGDDYSRFVKKYGPALVKWPPKEQTAIRKVVVKANGTRVPRIKGQFRLTTIGYHVQAENELSDAARRAVLIRALQEGHMTKEDMLDELGYLINKHMNEDWNMGAVYAWESDLKFVQSLQIVEEQPEQVPVAQNFYGAEHSDIRRLKPGTAKIQTLGELYAILRHCWSAETAYPSCQAEWVPSDPSYGQCAITAMLVYDMFGGSIHRIRVNGGGTHYFNKINGYYIDLTREQFDLYNIPVSYEPNEEMDRQYCGKNPDTQKRFRTLIQNISDYLEKSENG